MSTARTIWVVFCLAWAGFWILFGALFALTVIGLAFGLLMAGASVAAILIPVGLERPAAAALPVPPGTPAAELETRARLGGRSSVFQPPPRS